MDFFLDVPQDQFETANDLMRSRTDIVPLDSYPHPDDQDFHRMHFEDRERRDAIKRLLRTNDVECYKIDGDLTSSGLFIYQ